VFDLYGKPARKRYKTFVATWRPAGGAIRVVDFPPDGGRRVKVLCDHFVLGW
jgi:hypothetical protein